MKSKILIGPVGLALNKVLSQSQKILKTNKNGQHPDLFILKPENSIGISQIRKLIHFLNQKPFQAKHKIAIIYQADLMTNPAQNAFLKTLEEPPEACLIFLLTNQINRILPTIVSRCQVDRLKTPVKLLKNKDKILAFNQKLLKSSPGKRLVLITPFLKSKANGLKFIHQQTQFWQMFLISPDQFKSLKVSSGKARKILRLLIESNHDLDCNINLKICLDNLVLAW